MKTEIISEDLSKAAELIRRGELVAVPTETVYGLAGNGLDPAAVERIYEVKGRPAVKPLALMVHDESAMELYCEAVPRAARALAERFWPGPLSIVLKAKPIVPEIVRAGGDTVSLRCPMHEKTLELLRLSGLPFAAPSANPSGSESPKTAQRVLGYFSDSIAAVVDGGECGLGVESTIIDMSKTPYRILRQGALPESDIRAALRASLRIIGITGGTGCGKTTVLGVLQEMGALIIDCDAVYHELLESDGELISALRERFPEAFTGGEFSRRALGIAVFSDESRLRELNAITHGFISREIERRLENHAMQGGTLAAIDAIALIESGIAQDCELTVGVTASEEARIERIMTRDGIDREYAALRVSAQKPESFFRENCSRVIENDCASEQEFTEKCKIFFKEVL